MRTWLRQARRRLAEPIPVTRGMLHAFGLSIGVTFALAIGGMTYALLEVADEAQQRSMSDRRSQADIERIIRRVVRVERHRELVNSLERACRRFPSCATELDRAQRRERAAAEREQRRQRDDGPDRAPDQRADRPPRAPAQPPSTPSPTPGGGGDDPPTPPGASTPSTPPSSPNAPEPVVQVDIPPLDLDGDKGLLPQLLPDVNLPPVDVPPVRLP